MNLEISLANFQLDIYKKEIDEIDVVIQNLKISPKNLLKRHTFKKDNFLYFYKYLTVLFGNRMNQSLSKTLFQTN